MSNQINKIEALAAIRNGISLRYYITDTDIVDSLHQILRRNHNWKHRAIVNKIPCKSGIQRILLNKRILNSDRTWMLLALISWGIDINPPIIESNDRRSSLWEYRKMWWYMDDQTINFGLKEFNRKYKTHKPTDLLIVQGEIAYKYMFELNKLENHLRQ